MAKILVNDTILGPITENIDIKPIYTEKDIKKITICNKLLEDNNLPNMTTDEINYMLNIKSRKVT